MQDKDKSKQDIDKINKLLKELKLNGLIQENSYAPELLDSEDNKKATYHKIPTTDW